MAVLERSAAMGVIVAAPTAGSAGVVPGAVLASAKAQGASQQDLLNALWNSAAIGAIISRNATVAGAEVVVRQKLVLQQLWLRRRLWSCTTVLPNRP